ncbi:MAG: DNA polymerase III subunit epsilon [Chloroflexi bacterium]|nr:DNA polymerase III subunit epsilon [Chloroflexota bacterium]
MRTFVALDIETTGLDPQRDAILEIAAVLFDEHGPREEWHTLVNPGRAIPPAVTRLTGITDDLVVAAPPLEAVLDDLAAFVGNVPIVGHNVRFDLGFLQAAGLFRDHPHGDTYEAAAALWPEQPRYSLSALSQTLGLEMDDEHRALGDVYRTIALFWALVERAEALPPELLREMLVQAARSEPPWPGALILQTAQARQQRAGRRATAARWVPTFPPPPDWEPPPETPPTLSPRGVDPHALAEEFMPGGALERAIPGYEHRTEQVEMALAVAEALSQSRHLLIEAGTGTGKSLAYLLPAAAFALHNPGFPVVISTHTKNLQDQLLHKDIPQVLAAMNWQNRLRVAVLKGRSNYLCPRRLGDMLRTGPADPDETRVLLKVLVWLHDGGTGERSTLTLGRRDGAAWRKLSAEDEGCQTQVCLRRMEGACPFFQARRQAQQAHLVVVNHALLLSDAAAGGRILPDYRHLIVDEAHHLEAAATDALAVSVQERDLRRLLQDLGTTQKGALGRLLTLVRPLFASQPQTFARLRDQAGLITQSVFQFVELGKRLFIVLEDLLYDLREGRAPGRYAQQARLTPAVRTLPAWERVEAAWDEARLALLDARRAWKALIQDLRLWLEAHANDLDPDTAQAVEDALGRIRTLAADAETLQTHLDAIIFEPQDDQVYWVEQAPGRRPALFAAPLHVGGLMQELFWQGKDSVILTSATLTVAGSFEFIRQRLDAYDADTLALGSPFDYENAALLYLVNDIPEPSHPNYQVLLERALYQLALATRGRMLVLFTSYAHLERTARRLAQPLAQQGIALFRQDEGPSPQALIRAFREHEAAVLFGTRAFWEGVDIPGEDLSALVIAKLPFAVPSDPLVQARAEMYESPFWQYTLPDAILVFRQGFGRLIRTRTDRGIVAVLDRRMVSKSYGRYFLESLPPATLVVDSWRHLGPTAARWLGD